MSRVNLFKNPFIAVQCTHKELIEKIKSKITNFASFEKTIVTLNETIQEMKKVYSELSIQHDKMTFVVSQFLGHIPKMKIHTKDIINVMEREKLVIEKHVNSSEQLLSNSSI